MSNWLNYLQSQGAVISNGEIVHFGKEVQERSAALTQDVICPLTHFSAISARGEDTVTFLQGQLSNDVKLVTLTHTQLSAHNSPKGRVLALFRLLQRDGTFYLVLRNTLLANTLKRLRMFVLRSKVVLEDVSEHWVGAGVSGPTSDKLLRSIFPTLPANTDDCVATDRFLCVRVMGTTPRYEIYGAATDMQAFWQQIAPSATLASPSVWQWLDIINGVPSVTTSTVDEFVLQMLNLHALEGVSFTKGCYTGQEIVARMHYLGRLKRRMYLAHADTADVPTPGTDIYESGTDNTQSVGKVVDAQQSPSGGCNLLAVLQVGSVDANHALHLSSSPNAKLALKALPYEVPLERTT